MVRLFADNYVCYQEILKEYRWYTESCMFGGENVYVVLTCQMQYDSAKKETDQTESCFIERTILEKKMNVYFLFGSKLILSEMECKYT